MRVGTARLAGNGKALGEGESDGVAYIFADKSNDIIVGASVMGVHAVEVIHGTVRECRSRLRLRAY